MLAALSSDRLRSLISAMMVSICSKGLGHLSTLSSLALSLRLPRWPPRCPTLADYSGKYWLPNNRTAKISNSSSGYVFIPLVLCCVRVFVLVRPKRRERACEREITQLSLTRHKLAVHRPDKVPQVRIGGEGRRHRWDIFQPLTCDVAHSTVLIGTGEDVLH
jgi:hypothetical protein